MERAEFRACSVFVRPSRLFPYQVKRRPSKIAAELWSLHAVPFLYCVIVPRGNSHEIYSGRINSGDAYEASQAVEMMYPDATQLIVRKERALNAV